MRPEITRTDTFECNYCGSLGEACDWHDDVYQEEHQCDSCLRTFVVTIQTSRTYTTETVNNALLNKEHY